MFDTLLHPGRRSAELQRIDGECRARNHAGPLPAVSHKNPDAPLAVLLKDEQIRFDGGKMVKYSEAAFEFQNAQGLAAGPARRPSG